MSEIVTVVLEQGKAHARTEAQWKYNKGQKLQISGVDLPEYFEAHFSNAVNGKSKTMIGQNNIVEIPSEYFNPGTEIYCWIYVQEGSASVTKYEIVMPIRQRAEITDEEPTPQQESLVEQAISALNSSVTRTETAAQEVERIERELPGTIETALQEAKESGDFDGADGKDGADGNPGADGQDGQPGSDGVGIQSVVQTTTSTEDGGTNVVTVTKTDGTSSTFTVKNGSKGSTGATGTAGQSAYAAAQAGGYTDTQANFYADLAAMQGLAAELAAI